MGAFTDLKKFFKPDDRTTALPDDPFVVIDRERTVARLRLVERAKAHGERNFPPHNAATRDDVEEEIVAEVLEHANRARINASNGHRLYTERLSELALLRELSTITGASAQALGNFKATIFNREGRLSLAKDAIRESYQELATFKSDHGLSRPAHSGIGPIYASSIVAVSWLIESAANTAFLRVNDDYGLLGGFVAAAVVAAVNVFISAVVGRFWWPHLFHKSLVRKVLAAAGCAAWLVLLVIWNLLAGHFRDAKGAMVAHPETEALRLLTDRTWHFESIYSYGLLFAGIVFALLAATAAYKMKDPYPGYGDTYKRHQDRCDEYADEIELTLDELRETRDEAIESAAEIREELRRQFSERGQIIAARERNKHRFREHQDYLESIGGFLLSTYRAENVKARTDGLVPAHFDEKWSLGRVELPGDHEPNIDDEVVRAQAALADSIQTVSSAYQEAIDGLEHLDKIKRSLSNG
ncbi:hypothetical protein [Lysobacter soli]|uniref:hypothetical protein n=1 Tax=Lysobacter soli TaxID=453783 RepID=UPI00240F6096|nr:hypothetical protein [Lysobacter soli]MDG2518092.1 hypothetical protein [Lysobacter soli]